MTDLWIEIDLRGEGATAQDALDLRNALEQRIADAGVGTMIGGGVSLDGSSCDLEVRCENDVGTEHFVRQVLEKVNLGHTVSFRRN